VSPRRPHLGPAVAIGSATPLLHRAKSSRAVCKPIPLRDYVAVDATVHLPGDGERHPLGDSELVIKATGEQTGGTFFLSETTIAPGFEGPPPHRHNRLVDMFYVLDGVLSVRLGDETRHLGPGSFVCVPSGIVHTFSNASDSPAGS
jgi:quercetin dioxygenase-like cupin family protein